MAEDLRDKISAAVQGALTDGEDITERVLAVLKCKHCSNFPEICEQCADELAAQRVDNATLSREEIGPYD